MAQLRSDRLPPAPPPAAVAALVQEVYGVSAGLAVAIASGGLSRMMDAKALARQYKLIAAIDTTDARKAGLLR